MRPLKSLSLESIVQMLSDSFSEAQDTRSAERVNYTLHGTLMTGFAMFFFQHPSLLQFQLAMKKQRGRCNLETIFKVKEVPSETQMRQIVDLADAEVVRRLFPELFERVRRAGWAADYKTRITNGKDAGSYYVSALDGTNYFHSEKIACPSCLQRTDQTGGVHYYHSVVAATVVRAGTHRILPIDAEAIGNEDGTEKQDCEIKAGKRLVRRLRQEHPQLALIMTGDDLFSRVPFAKECESLRLHYVFVAKPNSHHEMMQWVEDLDRLGESVRGSWTEGPACTRKFYEYRIVKEVPLSARAEVYVNYVEVWERNKEAEMVYHNSWVTDVEVTTENVPEIVSIGRAKWKIENEQFNVQKNGGYELEHNYGHGKKNLSQIFYLLNLLAFLVHKIIERGDQLYQECLGVGFARRELWNGLRFLMHRFLVESWTQMLKMWLAEEAEASG